MAFEIRSVPALMIVRDGVTLYAEAGALREAAFAAKASAGVDATSATTR